MLTRRLKVKKKPNRTIHLFPPLYVAGTLHREGVGAPLPPPPHTLFLAAEQIFFLNLQTEN